MPTSSEDRPSPSGRITSVGVEHALLSYLYLDEGDLDGYASLLEDGGRFRATGPDRARGSEDAADLVFERYGGQGQHRPERVISSGTDVIVVGTLTRNSPGPGRPPTECFADFFTISEHGLLSTWRRFHALGDSTRKATGPD